ncbi:hypothetical protein HQQ80_21700 [Microbacteriaceae bacterium VKM Ac-2855]|nr:hypothetical protein [Microbacteriaceae bacterium VKM Ac-2855]
MSSANLPDTFAGGHFNLPLVVAKLVRLADGTHSEHERDAARRRIWSKGYFLDRAEVIWDKGRVPKIAEDDLLTELRSDA